MDDTIQLSAIALCTGVAFLLAAAVAVLLRRTQGVPPARRIRLMASLARSAVAGALPARWIVVSCAVGVFAFLGSLLVGLAVTILIVRAIPPEVPNPTEAYEGVGDALMAIMYFSIGAVVSLCVAIVIGIVVGESVAAQYCGGDSPSLNNDDLTRSSRV